MENLVLSFTVVFPLFVQLVLGYGLKRVKLLDDHTLGVCNKLVFRVFLPCLLFLNVYRADLALSLIHIFHTTYSFLLNG